MPSRTDDHGRRTAGRPHGSLFTLLLLVALVAAGAMARAEGEASDVKPIRTGKERLGVKASDEQRVDNCKVPVDLRGPKLRPDECGDGESTRTLDCGPSSAQAVSVFNFELIDTSLEGAVLVALLMIGFLVVVRPDPHGLARNSPGEQRE